MVGHDLPRLLALSIKQALTLGLIAAGCEVLDIGLATSPMAYYAQFDLDAPCVAMVTASHNENGWTGVKMGAQRPLTFGPDEMGRLKELVLTGTWRQRPGGSLAHIGGVGERYIADAASRASIQRPLKVVAACGNGTAGAFAPEALRRMGVAVVVEVDCKLDWTFPRYNPNPEDSVMLHAMAQSVRWRVRRRPGARLRRRRRPRCGVAIDDEEGEEIFADKIGLMLARDLSGLHKDATFVVDVKSDHGLFATDPVLKANEAKTVYWKTGLRRYIKRKTAELGALAGLREVRPASSLQPADRPRLRRRHRGRRGDPLDARPQSRPQGNSPTSRRRLPVAYTSLTMSPHVADEVKYGLVDEVVAEYTALRDAGGGTILGRRIVDLITVNLACAWRWRTAPGCWSAPPPTSQKRSWWWSRAPRARTTCAPSFRKEVKPRLAKRSAGLAPTIRKSELRREGASFFAAVRGRMCGCACSATVVLARARMVTRPAYSRG